MELYLPLAVGAVPDEAGGLREPEHRLRPLDQGSVADPENSAPDPVFKTPDPDPA